MSFPRREAAVASHVIPSGRARALENLRREILKYLMCTTCESVKASTASNQVHAGAFLDWCNQVERYCPVSCVIP